VTDRELDDLIVEKIFNGDAPAQWAVRDSKGAAVHVTTSEKWARIFQTENDFDEEWVVIREPQPYSTDIAAAWTIAEKRAITVTPIGTRWGAASCNFSQSGETTAVGMTNGRSWIVCDSAPRAICLAALKAVGVDTPA
jgi:hypothetical protein